MYKYWEGTLPRVQKKKRKTARETAEKISTTSKTKKGGKQVRTTEQKWNWVLSGSDTDETDQQG